MALPSDLDQFKQWFQSYTLLQKVGIFGSAAGVMVLLWVLVYFVNQADYRILYSELETEDALGVVQRLEGMSVEYQISDDMSTIRVPQDRLSRVRIDLAAEGLPSSGRIGFEIFDRTNFGLTNFQERVNYQRALEGELVRSITSLSEVDGARVHLVMESDSLFTSDADQTKASVILRLQRGRSIASASVNGIVHLVANSVKGLDPSRVTVVDSEGSMLTSAEDGSPMSGRQLDTRMTMESELVSKITGILEPVVGIGKVRPQVSLVMDWQQVEETIEEYDPEASVVRSQERITERSPGSNSGLAIGVPGPLGGELDDVGLTTAEPNAVAEGAGDYVTEQEVINFEVSHSIRHVVNAVGEIQRMSVAVILDNTTEVNVDEEGVETTVSVPWPDEDMERYRNLITATVGLDPARGDTLIVENVSFGNEVEVLPIEPPTMLERQAPLILNALRYSVIPIVFLIVYLLFLRPLQRTIFARWKPQLRPQLVAGSMGVQGVQTPISVSDFEVAMNRTALPSLPPQNDVPAIPLTAGAGGGPEDAVREIMPLATPNKADLIHQRIVEHAKKDPEQVAKMVRVMLNDDGD